MVAGDPTDLRREVHRLARQLGVDPLAVVARNNGPRTVWRARRVIALALALRGHGPAAIGRALGGRDRTAVARAIETAREQDEGLALELSANARTA